MNREQHLPIGDIEVFEGLHNACLCGFCAPFADTQLMLFYSNRISDKMFNKCAVRHVVYGWTPWTVFLGFAMGIL